MIIPRKDTSNHLTAYITGFQWIDLYISISYIGVYMYVYIYIWVNYFDLTATEPWNHG